MEHFSHHHPLIFHEEYGAGEGDMCYGCLEPILSAGANIKTSVYSCDEGCHERYIRYYGRDRLFLHKSCAELPPTITYPTHPKHLLSLYSIPVGRIQYWFQKHVCDTCGLFCEGFTYGCSECLFNICIKCVAYHVQSLENRSFYHPSQNQHPLISVQRPSLFKCDACNVEDNVKDLSYICTSCPFWMHKKCANAPTSFPFKFHDKHPLVLAYSLPQIYRKFHQFCNLCDKKLSHIHWLYYCPNCRFFAHFKCATSPMLRSSENEDKDVDESNLVHLPVADESSLNLLLEQLAKAMSPTDNSTSEPNHMLLKIIKHEAHRHILTRISKSHTLVSRSPEVCRACREYHWAYSLYGCETCDFYIGEGCIMKAGKVTHRWDPHPLQLIYDPGMVVEHTHEFNCEFCSEEIDTNTWFYHCPACDLSFHLNCFDSFY